MLVSQHTHCSEYCSFVCVQAKRAGKQEITYRKA